MLIDLHCHSTASDGDLNPPDLVAAAASAGVGTLALTDHDTMEGIPAAIVAGDAHGVRVVPGIELTVRVPTGSMHLLGYFSVAEPRPLVDRLAGVAGFREERIRRIVERLGELGVELDWGDVRGRAAGQLGRPHVAAALVDAGYVASIEEAFDRWLADGKPAHVPSKGLEPDAAVRVVRESGGAPVLAHPASLALPARHLSSFVQRLASFGLVGMEVHRPEHRPEQRDAYAQIARRLRLVPSGGSDFHRPDAPFGLRETCRPALPPDTLDRLFACIAA